MIFKHPIFKRALKHLLVALHALLVMGLLVAVALMYLVFHPNGLSFLNTYILPPLGIHTQAEGSLTNGVTLRNLHTNTIDAKTLTLDYNLTAMLKGQHVIDSVTIDGLRIHLDDFMDDRKNSSLPLPTFALKKVTLTNLQLISAYPVELNLYGKNGSFDGKKLNFKEFKATVATRHASAALSGAIHNSSFAGAAFLYPNKGALDPYISKLTTLPVMQPLKVLELSPSRVQLNTQIDRLNAAFDSNVSLQNIALSMEYRYSDHLLNFDFHHTLVRGEESLQIAQKLSYHLNGTMTTSLEGLITSSRPLPSKIFTAHFRNDPQGVAGRVVLGGSELLLQSGDYDHFVWNLTSLNPTLDFFPTLPENFRHSYFNANAQGNFTASTKSLEGKLTAHHNHANINGSLQIHNDAITFKGELLLPKDAPTWREWSLKPPSKTTLFLTHNANITQVNLKGDELTLLVQRTNNAIKGSGNYLESTFTLNGTMNLMTITTATPSLAKTLSSIPSFSLPNIDYYDAEITSTTQINTETMSASTDIVVPWYGVIIDPRHQYSGIHNTLSIHYRNGDIVMDKYRLDIADHPIFSNQPSYAHIDAVGNFILDDIRIFDTLRLNGSIDPATFATQLHLTSENFSYKGPEGNAHVATDVYFTRDGNATQNLEGSLTLLDATIDHLPLQQFKGKDEDIIIVQDIRPPSTTPLGMM